MYTLNVATNYLFLANRESLTLAHRGPTFAHGDDPSEGNRGTETVADCKRLCADVAERDASNGAYQVEYLDFRLPTPNVASEPQPGDLLIDGDNRVYVIQDVDEPQLGAAWRCYSVRLRLEDLGTTITVMLPTDSIDEYGSPLTTLAADPDNTGIACALQQYGTELVEYQGQRGIRRLLWCWTFEQFEFRLGTILQDNAGRRYTVAGWQDKKRIDALQKLQLREDL